jgi:hypothetical protein
MEKVHIALRRVVTNREKLVDELHLLMKNIRKHELRRIPQTRFSVFTDKPLHAFLSISKSDAHSTIFLSFPFSHVISSSLVRTARENTNEGV